MIDPDNAILFLEFVQERHRIWERRLLGRPQPWTENPVLKSQKFTNVFRVLDPGSQFVVTDLMCENPFEFLSRCLLYRITNLPEAWKSFPGEVDLTNRPQEFRDHLHDYKASGGQVFSGAYMVWGGTEKGKDKIDHVVDVLLGAKEGMGDFLQETTQRGRFEALRRCSGMGVFNSMQVLTDFGYSTEFREDDFVVAGPGARRGAAHLDPEADPVDVIEWGYQAIRNQDFVPTVPQGNRERLPSLMDIQNCLCEFSKYVRYLSRPSTQKPYRPAHPGVQSNPVLPKHW